MSGRIYAVLDEHGNPIHYYGDSEGFHPMYECEYRRTVRKGGEEYHRDASAPVTPSKPSLSDPLTLALGLLDGSAGIERAEEIASKEARRSAGKNLPVNGSSWGEEKIWEEAGFKLGPTIKGDKLFREATWPEGWCLRSTDHYMWSDILDDRGRKRGSYMYKGSSWDRDANCSLMRRFVVAYADITAKYIPGHRPLRKDARVITDGAYASTDPRYILHVVNCPDDFVATKMEHWTDSYWDANREDLAMDVRGREAERLACLWLDENFPNHKNPNTHWDYVR